jgi:spermidine synthase
MRPSLATLVPAFAALASIGAFAWPAGPLRTDPGQVLEAETAYQTVRVVEGEEQAEVLGPHGPWDFGSATVRSRFLRFDEDTESYQSVHVLGADPDRLTFGRYYDHVALGLWFEGMPWTKPGTPPPRVLLVGYAGGTLARVIAQVAPAGRAAETIGVELDPDVPPIALASLDPARRLEAAATLRTGEDGRTVVASLAERERFDLIVVDAYQRTQYVPFQLATVEFFRACVARLALGGALGINVIAPSGVRGRLLASLATTLAVALEPEGRVWIVPNPEYTENATVWGLRRRRAPRVSPAVPASLAGPAAALDRMTLRHVPGGGNDRVLTDDLAPTESLTDEGLLAEPVK